jgi:DNA-binding transcriptional MerR regulator
MIKKEGVAVVERSSQASLAPAEARAQTAAPTLAPSSPSSSSPSGPPRPAIALPERKYFKIGEVAELVGVEPHVLRYWETQFSQLRPHKARSGHRLYRRREVETLLVIKDLLHIQRFTIAGARQALRAQGTTSLLPRAAEHAAAEQLSLPPTPSMIEALAGDDGDDSEDEIDGDEVELHLADPARRRSALDSETEIEIEARDGEDLDDALALQLAAQKAHRGGKGLTRIELRHSAPPGALRVSRAGGARARGLLVEAAHDLERVLAQLQAR